ncbi:MAG: tetratricopeptide repeat protein [Bacteroidia bacterium]|nr:tetratricopeptide repeat protein [Bacteroidia bacterium]
MKQIYISFLLAFLILTSVSSLSAQSFYDQGINATDNLQKVEFFTRALEKEKKDNWTYYRRGWAYYSLHNYSRALSDFKAALNAEGNLDDSYTYTGIAWVYYDLRDYDLCEQNAKKSLELRADNYSAYNILGWAAAGNENYDKALENFTKYINLKPDSYIGYSDRSYIYLIKGDYNNVLKDCEKALSLEPGYDRIIERKALALLRLGREDEGIKLIKDKIDFKANDPISMSEIGNLFYRAGDYRGAIEFHDRGIHIYETKIKEDPKFITIHKEDIYNIYMSRGDAYEALSELPHALQNYSRATQIDAKNYRAWIEIGETQTFQNNYREAVAAYERAFSLKPDLKDGWVNLGYCYDHLNDRQKAINAYTRGIQADPENGLLYNNRGFAYLEEKQYEKSKADLEKAIQVEPAMVMSHVSLGEYYYEVKQYEAAIRKLDEAIKMENGSLKAYAQAWYKRGLTNMAREDYKTAISDFQECLNLQPDRAEAWQYKGISNYKIKENCKAYLDLKKALEADQKNKEKEAKEAALYLAKLTRNPCNE